MVKQINEERRSYVRAKRVLSIEYKLKKRNSKKINFDWKISTTQDMSVCGLSFYSECEFRPKDIIELHVMMSGVLEIFNGMGRVVRVEKKKSGAFYLVAVQLIRKDPRSRSAKTYMPASKNRIKSKN